MLFMRDFMFNSLILKLKMLYNISTAISMRNVLFISFRNL